MSNPWNGKVVLEAFWWDCHNAAYEDWYTYLAKLAPRLKSMGFDGIWTPPPCKGSSPAHLNMGYFPFDYYDIGQKNQQDSVATKFGSMDSFLRMIAVCHANGLEVYPDIVLDHCDGGNLDTNSPTNIGNRYTSFQFDGFAGPNTGRWPKSWLDFHSNPVHWNLSGDWTQAYFGPDICFQGRCSDSGSANQNSWMRAGAREWFVWFVKQTGVDGFRFDDVKGYPPEVVEDLLYNAMGSQKEYFCVGEYVGGSISDQDGWCDATNNRCGVFDYDFRGSLVNLVESNGFFDMSSLPGAQQGNRYKTVPFLNNHDVYRGMYWDSSGNSSSAHDQRSGDWARNPDELGPTIDPDNTRAELACAVMAAVDGNPQIYYEDLFINFLPQRYNVDADAIPTRPYVENIVWCHQKLGFKAGAYKVRFQGSKQLLIIERSAKAIIAVNNDGAAWHGSWIPTDFGPNVELHDYSGARPDNIRTNADGWVDISVPPVSYCIWGPTGITGGFTPPARSTTQEFQMDDDLGDSDPASPGYGGKLIPTTYRTAGAIWPATNSMVTVTIYLDSPASVDLQIFSPDSVTGQRTTTNGSFSGSGFAPLVLSFHTAREGYHLIQAKLTDANAAPVRGYIKVNYTGPAETNLF